MMLPKQYKHEEIEKEEAEKYFQKQQLEDRVQSGGVRYCIYFSS
jgi:hypothetical protein